MRCVVLESQAVFAEVLGSMLSSLGDVELVLATHEMREARAACRAHRPNLILLGSSGCSNVLADAAQLARVSPQSRAIVLGARLPAKVPSSLRAFVYSVIDGGGSLAVLRGEIWRLRSEMRCAPATGSAAPGDPSSVLGPRELVMFRLIGRGMLSKQIADEMNLSKASVDTYRKRIAAKLRTSGAELVRMAALHGQSPLAA